MKKIIKNGCFSLTALLLTVLLTVGCLSTPVGAAAFTATTVKEYDFGSIGSTADLTVEQVINNIAGQSPKPVVGVEYIVYKIGDLFNIQTADGWMTGYGIQKSVANTLKIASLADGTGTYNGTAYCFYTASDAQQKINTALEGGATTPSFAGGREMTTDQNGQATAQGLTFGLYLLVQSDISGATDVNGKKIILEEAQTPVVFQLPQWENGAWQTQAKVSVKSGLIYEELKKTIVGTDGSQSGSTTAQPGNVLEFQLNITPPVLSSDQQLTRFAVEDILSAGLEFKRILSMTDARNQTYDENVDYRLTIEQNLTPADLPQDQQGLVGGSRVLLEFTAQGISKVRALSGQALYIEYTALVTGANPTNSARMIYDIKSDTPDNPPNNPPTNPPNPPTDPPKKRWERDDQWDVVYSYSFGVEMNKYLGDQQTPAGEGSVVFELYSGADKQPVMLEQQADGSYMANTEAASNRLSVDAQGRISLYGLPEGTYYLREIQTADGYALPDEDICITLCGEKVNGEYTGRLDVYQTTVDGQMGAATVKDDILSMSVINPRTMYIPNTGGSGTWMFTVGGLVILLGGVIYLVVSRRRKHE